jgi:hypothetical protein
MSDESASFQPVAAATMSGDPLSQVGAIALPPHRGKGGFDHAAVHAASGHVYVAHTANDAVDVIDPVFGQCRLPIGPRSIK